MPNPLPQERCAYRLADGRLCNLPKSAIYHSIHAPAGGFHAFVPTSEARVEQDQLDLEAIRKRYRFLSDSDSHTICLLCSELQKVRAERDEARAEIARLKLCSTCGTPFIPGIPHINCADWGSKGGSYTPASQLTDARAQSTRRHDL